MQKKQVKNTGNKNPLETLKDIGSSTVQNTFDSLSSIGNGMFDQFFGSENSEQEQSFSKKEKKQERSNKEFKIFNYTEYSETTLIKQKIKELTDLIKREIQILKNENSSLMNEVKDIEKLTLSDKNEKPGIYHIRFLEIVLSMIRHIRAKVGESKTWLEALMSKKKKRGSLFAARSKKSGTQYSLSQELQSARSIQ